MRRIGVGRAPKKVTSSPPLDPPAVQQDVGDDVQQGRAICEGQRPEARLDGPGRTRESRAGVAVADLGVECVDLRRDRLKERDGLRHDAVGVGMVEAV